MRVDIYKGDSKQLTVTVTDANGAFNLAGYTMRMTVKKKKTDTTAIFTLTATVATPATGIGVFAISKSNSNITAGVYFYDVEISNGTTVKTIVVDKFVVAQDLTPVSA